MGNFTRISTIEDIRVWIAKHDASITAWWQEQWRKNETIKEDCADLDRRLTAVEKKVIWFSAFAAGAGSVIGTLLVQVMK